MKTYLSLRSPGMRAILFSLIAVLFFISCSKIDLTGNDDYYDRAPQNINSKIVASVSGFITNESDIAIPGAVVQFGTSSITTDEYGYFEINDAEVPVNAPVVTINKYGYFKGIKNIIVSNNEPAFFRIQLIPKINAGIINGATGGRITLNNGLSILFPSNAVVNATSGLTYTGPVKVAAFWINPSARELEKIMPGNLLGVTTGGELKKLTSYGMAAVELTGSSNELLQIAPGQKATMTMPVTAEVLSYAPASIPLWYFNEAKGLWEEQGKATRSGNSFIGEVSHFSFWNYDTEESFVEFNCTVVNAGGNPIQNEMVKISAVNNPYNASFGFTNAQGYVSGYVPANTVLRLEIMGDVSCNTTIFTHTFTTANSNISLGTLAVNAISGIATVSGILTDCKNNPVGNGSVIMQKNNQYYRYPVNKNGSYNFSTVICSNTAVVSLMAHDARGAQYSAAADYTLTAGTNTAINLKACGNSSSQFITYTINGVSYSFTYPADNFAPVTPDANFTFEVTNELNHSKAGFRFPGTNIGPNSNQLLSYFTSTHLPEPVSMNGPVNVTITESGEDDQIFAGHFSGMFRGASPNNNVYNISCSFRVKCQM